jgi:hypothetical protein
LFVAPKPPLPKALPVEPPPNNEEPVVPVVVAAPKAGLAVLLPKSPPVVLLAPPKGDDVLAAVLPNPPNAGVEVVLLAVLPKRLPPLGAAVEPNAGLLPKPPVVFDPKANRLMSIGVPWRVVL